MSLFNAELLIILEIIFVGLTIFFILIQKDFNIGIYIWLLSVLFFKYQRITLIGSSLPDLSIDRVLFVFLVLMFIFLAFAQRQRLNIFYGIGWAMFLFCLIAILSMIWTNFILKEDGRLKIGQLLTGYVYPFSIFFISSHTYDTRDKREGFIKFIVLLGIYLCLTAIFEHFDISQFIWPDYIKDPYFGIHFGRARGPFAQAAFNGTVIGFAFIASMYFLFRGSKILWKVLSIVLLLVSPLALFFTYTRAVWIAALIGFIITIGFFLRHRKKMVILITIVLCSTMALAIFLSSNEETLRTAISRLYAEQPVYDRLNLYIASLNMFRDRPLFGVGFGRFSEEVLGYYSNIDSIHFQNDALSAHDTLIGILAEMGIIGLLLIFYIYYVIFLKSRVLYRHLSQSPDKFLVYIFWGICIVFLINAIFIDMRYSEFINSIFFISAGIIIGWERYYYGKII